MSKIFKLLLVCMVVVFSISAHADDDIEDQIDVVEGKGKVIAIVRGERSIPAKLRPREKVLWSDARGKLGAFLTDDRFFVISTLSSSWQELPLKLNEGEQVTASVSPYIALLVTGRRAVSYKIKTGWFIETRIPLDDEVLMAKTDRRVAVVVTNNRVLGLGERSSSFSESRLRIKEQVEDVKTTAGKVVVRTSDRLLSFSANGSLWREHRLD